MRAADAIVVAAFAVLETDLAIAGNLTASNTASAMAGWLFPKHVRND